MPRPVLLLSATIHCTDTPYLERRDPEIRESDYRWAIKGWMGVKGYDTLIFCENSGADLSKLEEYAASINKFQHNLIFLSYNGNSRVRERGKGYGELEIIRHVIDEVKGLPPEQMFLKVSGRYRARNATRFLSKLESAEAEICCDLRHNLTFADSRLFAITPRCAREHFLSRQYALNDFENKMFEHVLADAVHGAIMAGRRWSPLPCDPSLYGVAASGGIRFGFSPIARLRSKARHFLAKRIY